MKTYIRNLSLFCILMGGFFASCDLDVVPPAEMAGENFWKTEKDAWYFLNTCYQSMPAVDIWDEMCTDNFHSQKPWEGNMEMVQQNGINTASIYGNYDFSAVRMANTYLAHVDGCDMSEELKARTKAEARFFRAFAYLELTQYYGKVAIVTQELPYDAPNVSRNSLEEVHNFILNELEEAAKVLPESYSGGFMNEEGRVTRYGALALRARAALYFGNYIEAEKSARAVIDSHKYSLFKVTSLTAMQEQEAREMDLYIDFDALGIDKNAFIKGMFSYESLWHGANAAPSNPEYVLTHEYMGDPNAYNAYGYTFFLPKSMAGGHGYSSFEPMQDLVDAYWKADGKTLPEKISVETRKANYEKIWNIAKKMSGEEYKKFVTSPELMTYEYMQEFKNRDSRLYVTLVFPFKGWHETEIGELYFKWDPAVVNSDGNESWTGFSSRKTVALKPYIASPYGSEEDYPTIRYAEVLLTFAEAHLMINGYDGQVRSALNQLRERCGMPDVPEVLGREEAIDFLRNERRIELAVEGHRYDDVRRYGHEYCMKFLNGPSTAPDGSIVVNKKWDDRLMLMPIPIYAIDVNPLLKNDQNPGY